MLVYIIKFNVDKIKLHCIIHFNLDTGISK